MGNCYLIKNGGFYLSSEDKKKIESINWVQNSSVNDGYVPASGGAANKVYKTNESGEPSWGDLAIVATSGSYSDLKGTEDVATKAYVGEQIDAVEIIGLNYLSNTKLPGAISVNTPSMSNNFQTFDPYSTPGRKKLGELGFEANDQVTLSFDWQISQNESLPYTYGYVGAEWLGWKDGSDNQYLGSLKSRIVEFSEENTNGHVVTTIVLNDNALQAHTIRLRFDECVLNFTISNCKLEKGDKATDWTLSLYDIDEEIGGTNILRGTNTVRALTSNGEWSNTHWRSASGGEGTRESFDVDDAPNPNIHIGWRITRQSGDLDISQDYVPVQVGETYTMSCYARGTGGLSLQYGKGGYIRKIIQLSNVTEWKRYAMTFVVGAGDDGSDDGSTSIYFGNRDGTSSIEICGMKLEHGNKATDWSPAPDDLLSVNGTAVASNKLIGTDVSTITRKSGDGTNFYINTTVSNNNVIDSWDIGIETATKKLFFNHRKGNVDAYQTVYTTKNPQPTVDKLTTSRKIQLTGAVTGESNFDGSSNAVINTNIGDIPNTLQYLGQVDGWVDGGKGSGTTGQGYTVYSSITPPEGANFFLVKQNGGYNSILVAWGVGPLVDGVRSVTLAGQRIADGTHSSDIPFTVFCFKIPGYVEPTTVSLPSNTKIVDEPYADPGVARADYFGMMAGIEMPSETSSSTVSTQSSPSDIELPSIEDEPMHSKAFETVQLYYKTECWTEQMIKNAIDKWITAAEAEEILSAEEAKK